MQQLEHLFRKAVFSLLTLAAVLIFNFFLFRIIPGDPLQMVVSPRMPSATRERVRVEYGLDQPIWLNIEEYKQSGDLQLIFNSQFFHYLQNLLKGNLGESFRQRQPVSELIAARLGPTVLLIVAGEVTGILFGSILGLVAAWKKGTPIDAAAMFIGLTAWALPAFWLGLVLLILARGHLPSGGYISPGVSYTNIFARWLDIARHLVLPASTLALLLFGAYMLVVRNSTLEVLAEDYILTAKAKGLTATQILRDHALKNASLPLVTIIALDLGYALGGAIQIETIFSWPGVGRLMFDSIATRDYPVLQGVFLLLAVSGITANFLADITYSLLYPRG
ncbi:MAG: ABC transporter permease, partial [Chloroflexi bacterium]|nr:ABC transporter permease [Chloroflexota bacterium]